jgi:hypothetical protein
MRRVEGSGTQKETVAAPEVGLPNWIPLELRIGSRCAEFMWMYRQNGYEHYKHIDTRRYLILDSRGTCFRREGSDFVSADFHDQLQRVIGGR